MTVEQASGILSEWLTSKPAEVKAQKAAMEHYGKYFSPENLKNITEEEFKNFLLLKNNKHWSGLHRQPQITKIWIISANASQYFWTNQNHWSNAWTSFFRKASSLSLKVWAERF